MPMTWRYAHRWCCNVLRTCCCIRTPGIRSLSILMIVPSLM
ncbi:hypothetical protein [Rock bream iridovirus]|uniref:Uncharacterized protein n=2 Tax=Infectious spleen and kidney necrosis virus TaxID=180170 RepID=M1SWQ6_ISKNV|nr:ORF24L [Orange-spotted grouper iridovirus]AGG37902.1 hypothetical protein [Rock bream iridovirus]